MHVSAATTAEEQLARELATLTKFILHSTGRDFYAAVGELELSLTQVRALHFLTAEAEEASLKQLADAIGLSLPAASRSVDGLVQRGLVTRTENAEDRRAKALRATDEARAHIDRLSELRVAGITDFVATLPPRERRRLAEALTPIVASLPPKNPHEDSPDA